MFGYCFWYDSCGSSSKYILEDEVGLVSVIVISVGNGISIVFGYIEVEVIKVEEGISEIFVWVY